MPKRREGPVRSRQTGYYYLDIIVGFEDNRRRVRFSLRTKDPAKAQFLWEQEYKRLWSDYYGLERTQKPQEKTLYITMTEYLAHAKNIKRIKTWKTTGARLDIIGELWGDMPLHRIGQDQFIQLDTWLKEHKRSLFTINHYFALLKTFFNWTIEKGYYTGKNPILAIKPYVVDQKRRAYSADEICRILDAADRVEQTARANARIQKYAKRIVLLCLYTGMRLGEVLNLKWDNINDEKIVLKRTETKQRKEKIIPLTENLRMILSSLKDNRFKNGYVIPLRRRSGEMRAGWADSIIKKIRLYSGIQDFIFHNLRHTAATIMVKEALGRGASYADIMLVLGHSQPRTTMQYQHPSPNGMRKAMEAVEEKTKKG